MQLDIFNDSRDVMLRNDVLCALQRHDELAAGASWQALQLEYPTDVSVAELQLLIEAMQARSEQAGALTDHAALRQARLELLNRIEPVACSLMGQPGAAHWLRAFWQALVQRAAHLPFQAESEADHAAPILLHMQDWQGAHDAVAGIESWRRIPAPLAWMAQARLRLSGLRAAWPLLAELAWMSPKRLYALIQAAPDPTLQRLRDQFDASFEPVGEAADAAQDLAWFPAWVLTAQPHYLADLAKAQPGQHSAPEQAMRLLVNLLGLERQGRHHDIVLQRRSLRDLHPGLYRAYLKTR